jgi:lipopolysaccharide export LptBFGC system permease protein LptF
MPFSGMLLYVAFVRTDIFEESIASKYFLAACVGCPLPLMFFLAHQFFVTLMMEATFLRNVGSYKSHML